MVRDMKWLTCACDYIAGRCCATFFRRRRRRRGSFGVACINRSTSMLITSASFTLLKLQSNGMCQSIKLRHTWFGVMKSGWNWCFTLFNEILLDPTNVVLNSLPTTPTTVVAAAGDWVGLGLKTTALVFGLLIWLKDCRRIGAHTYTKSIKTQTFVVFLLCFFFVFGRNDIDCPPNEIATQ